VVKLELERKENNMLPLIALGGLGALGAKKLFKKKKGTEVSGGFLGPQKFVEAMRKKQMATTNAKSGGYMKSKKKGKNRRDGCAMRGKTRGRMV